MPGYRMCLFSRARAPCLHLSAAACGVDAGRRRQTVATTCAAAASAAVAQVRSWLPLLLLVSRPGAAGSCDLDPWLQAEPGADHGYHVLCIHEASAAVHHNGHIGCQVSNLDIDDAFAEALTSSLGIADELDFLPHRSPTGTGSWTGGRLRWKKQSWAIFTADGLRVPPGSEVTLLKGYEGVALLYEGGLWRWPSVRIGYERQVLPGVSLRTVSLRPALFELLFSEHQHQEDEHVLNRELLEGIVEFAEPRLMRSMTEGRVSDIRTSDQMWASYQTNLGLRSLHNLTARMLNMPGNFFESNLQVLRYKKEQFYDAHRDYWDPREFPDENRFLKNGLWSNRWATVLWFLQAPASGGETWFPRAHGGPIPWSQWTACDHRGVKMGGSNGAPAILFYSLYSSGEIDEFSWHCGCPVGDGVKWAANSWLWNLPFGGGSGEQTVARSDLVSTVFQNHYKEEVHISLAGDGAPQRLLYSVAPGDQVEHFGPPGQKLMLQRPRSFLQGQGYKFTQHDGKKGKRRVVKLRLKPGDVEKEPLEL